MRHQASIESLIAARLMTNLFLNDQYLSVLAPCIRTQLGQFASPPAVRAYARLIEDKVLLRLKKNNETPKDTDAVKIYVKNESSVLGAILDAVSFRFTRVGLPWDDGYWASDCAAEYVEEYIYGDTTNVMARYLSYLFDDYLFSGAGTALTNTAFLFLDGVAWENGQVASNAERRDRAERSYLRIEAIFEARKWKTVFEASGGRGKR